MFLAESDWCSGRVIVGTARFPTVVAASRLHHILQWPRIPTIHGSPTSAEVHPIEDPYGSYPLFFFLPFLG